MIKEEPEAKNLRELFILNCMYEGHAQYVSTSIIASYVENQFGFEKGTYSQLNDEQLLTIDEKTFEHLDRMIWFEKSKDSSHEFIKIPSIVYKIGYAYMKSQYTKGFEIKNLHKLILNPPKNYGSLLEETLSIFRVCDIKEDAQVIDFY